ncbi:MAG: hypothetical protein RL112_1513 [Planctomycetota bacterium]
MALQSTHLPRRRAALLPAIVLGLLSNSCGSGSGAPSSSGQAVGPSQLQLALSSTPEPGLLAVDARILSVRLVDADGAPGDELLEAPVHVDLQHCSRAAAWLVSRSIASGDYAGVRIELDGLQPRGFDGAPLPVEPASAVATLAFAAPARWHAGAGRRSVAQLDLAASLVDDGGGTWSFSPQGSASAEGAIYGEPVRALRGVVLSFDAERASCRLAAQVDEDGNADLGRIELALADSTLMIDAANALVADRAAYALLLQPGSSVLEVRGCLADGRLRAERVELVSTNGSPHLTLAKLEGLVSGWDEEAGTFDLRVASVTRGRDLVAPAGLAPDLVSFATDAATTFALVDGSPATFAEFAAQCDDGARVTVRCATWTPGGARLVAKLELDEPHDVYAASILDAEGAPATIFVQLDPSEEAIADGSADAEVELSLLEDQLVLDLGQGALATLPASELQAGQRLNVTATLPAKGTSLLATAERVVVVAGRREGVLVAAAGPGADAVLHSLPMPGDLPFGAAVDASVGAKPLRFAVDCVVRGDLDTRAALLATVGHWPNLRARVRGVASADGAIVVHAIEVDL